MAKEHGANVNLLPEERVAVHFAARHGLGPPVDVESVANSLGRLEFVTFPFQFQVDAVTVHVKGAAAHRRILIDSSAPLARRRFTLAHEIGHIVIPWHFGTQVSHFDLADDAAQFEYVQVEAEANRFASALLMPPNWLRAVVANSVGIGAGFQAVAEGAQVSVIAALFAMCRALDPGFLFVTLDSSGIVTYSGASPGTLKRVPAKGSKGSEASLFVDAQDRWVERHGAQTYILARYAYLRPLATVDQGDDWRSLLDLILEQLAIPARTHVKIKQSIGGVFGHANNKANGNPEAFNYFVRERIAQDSELSAIARHQLFDRFATARILEILHRRH